MKKKKILIDLTPLKNVACGFGQIAINYGKLFDKINDKEMKFIFLVPDEYNNAFGNNVEYKIIKPIYKIFPSLLPRTDIWHSIYQQFRYFRKSFRTQQILTIHDLNFLFEKTPAKAQKYSKRLQSRMNQATVITAISEYVKKEIETHLDPGGKEIQVIYNGVQKITEDEAIQPGFVTENRPFFFTIGQIRKKKNFHVLLEVMQSFSGHNLYIVGDDHNEYANFIRKKILEKNITNVFLPGTINHKEKVWLYKNCEAFLFPSRFEGFGLPVIEAMQFGKAVFSSPMTSLTEVCGGYAFLWEEDFNPEKMVQLIKDNLPGFYERKDFIEGMKAYASSFSYEKHIEQYLNLYRQLLKQD